MISVKKTSTVDSDVRQQFGEHDPQRARALRDRGLDELLLPQRQDLPAQRTPDVRDETYEITSVGYPDAARVDVDPPVMETVDPSALPSAIASSTTGNA